MAERVSWWKRMRRGMAGLVLVSIVGFLVGALVVAMEDEVFPRPLSYDLLEEMLEKLDGEVTRLVVHSLKDNTYYANLYIETPDGEWVFDCRPSDGMVLVTRLGAPIYITPQLFERETPSPQA